MSSGLPAALTPCAPVRTQRLLQALFLLMAGALLGAFSASSAHAQSCDESQAQLTQAIVDSQTALDRTETTLQTFDQALISPREAALDTAPIVAARASVENFISALSAFRTQIGSIGDACGPAFANDVRTLDGLIAGFQAQQQRADQLLSGHQALLDSGEPMVTQAQMETVQRALTGQGYYGSVIDGRFGAGTRASIRAWQAASGMPATGYLTSDQLQQLLAAPAPAPEEVPGVTGLPPAPSADGAPQAPAPTPTPADAQTQQVCADNTNQVNVAVQRTQDFRQDASSRSDDLRTALRRSRTTGFSSGAAGELVADVDSYLEQILAFYGEAQPIASRCGDAYDTSLAALTREIDTLRGVRSRAAQLADDYQQLVASNEPALSEQEMRRIQQGLANRGHYSGGIDALFGPGTRNAIRAYQAEMGESQTGYLTAVQAAELQRAATVTEPAPVPEAPAATIETPQAPDEVTVDVVLQRMVDDLGTRDPVESLADVQSDDGSFGDWYTRLHAAHTGGSPRSVVDQRLALLGAAYMDRSASSVEMVDAHILIADAYVALGLYADAALHVQRAYDVWQELDREDLTEGARLQEQLATLRLVNDLGDGELDQATAEEVEQVLGAARLTAQQELGTRDVLSRRIVDRLADLSAAGGETPSDSAVAAALDARYPR
ncbi:MAG: peptidoglycan-binding protein [Alphaproteobacteria bacterium]